MTKKPNIILWDVETSPIIANTWSLYPKYLSHDTIIQDWFMICAAWKTLGSKSVQSVAITQSNDDYHVVKTLRDALAQADVIIGHNSDKFDQKKLNARIIYHGLDPLPQIPTIDTLKEVRKVAAFTSNRLDYLTKFLIGEGKLKTGYELWLKAMNGNKRAIKEMVSYNKVDVVRLEELYVKLRPYMKTHVHVGVLMGEDRLCSCPKCGSTNIKKNGLRVTAAGLTKQEIQCQNCFSYHRIPVVKL